MGHNVRFKGVIWKIFPKLSLLLLTLSTVHVLCVTDVPDGKAVLPNVSADFVTETLSQGITFRDPETGVLYVQTQLLQVSNGIMGTFTVS